MPDERDLQEIARELYAAQDQSVAQGVADMDITYWIVFGLGVLAGVIGTVGQRWSDSR